METIGYAAIESYKLLLIYPLLETPRGVRNHSLLSPQGTLFHIVVIIIIRYGHAITAIAVWTFGTRVIITRLASGMTANLAVGRQPIMQSLSIPWATSFQAPQTRFNVLACLVTYIKSPFT